MNSVSNLLLKPFSLHSMEEKLEIKALGRPVPELNIEQTIKSKNRQYIRKFNASIYDKHIWICGCEKSNSLFCFPCLLFGGEYIWTKTGVTDINHLTDRIRKHETSKSHIKNDLSLSLFGKLDIARQLDSEYRNSVHLHNEKVKNNRYVLNSIVNCIRFCGAFELALRGHNETEFLTNPSVFGGLVDFSAELDLSLKAYAEKAAAFKGTSKAVQDEILQIMLEVCQEGIVGEIRETHFVSIIVDETSDVANTNQMVVLLRYVVNGKPTERFWNFVTPQKHDTKTLASCLLKELESLGINKQKYKLISQTYNGANLMRGSLGGVQAILKQTYPQAEYIHCYTHQLNLVMLNAASVNRNVRIFFADLQGICTFFSNSPQRTAMLDQVARKRIPHSVPARWNFHSQTVNTVFAFKEEIKECLRVILNSDEISNINTISLASGHIKTLESKNFTFWLSFFHKVMPHVDILFGQLQKRNVEPWQARKCISAFEEKVIAIKEKVVLNVPENTVNETNPESTVNEAKRRKTDSSELKKEAKEVCDIIICQIKERFKFTGHLIAATLFQPEMFPQYDTCFPDRSLNEICVVYPFIDSKKIKTELSVIYSTEEFHTMSGAIGLYDFIVLNSLEETFSECVKLLQVLITIPMTTSETERCFPTLKKIKTFVRNTMGQERLSALAMLSVEKDFIMNLSNFNQRVIDKFSNSKDRQMDFLFK
ncbi:zinc finger MYM-type protein 1-like [Periplaneta americana]|uniref:zinc finger MYM-type protein 1-like n=1 Tax=Periplaneta americana TaxID=6978 RepID=UPI0037E94CBC